MAGPSESLIRPPAVAGLFYPADPTQCRALARTYTEASLAEEPTRRRLGGVVPHAGWVYSGSLAGLTIGTIARSMPAVDLVVIFGAIHVPIPTECAVVDTFGSWLLPGDACDVQSDVRSRLLESRRLFSADNRFHEREHAAEVELPLVRSAWPDARILPVQVPARENAVEVGRATARLAVAENQSVVFLASSDLTHYGPAYGFAPHGVGEQALNWAKENDMRLIDRILSMQAESIVPQVRENSNACGPGAIAAMLAACGEMGASEARLLRHANSFESAEPDVPRSADNAVGYASIVVD